MNAVLITINGEPDCFKDMNSLKEYLVDDIGWQEKAIDDLIARSKHQSSFVIEESEIVIYPHYTIC